MRNYGPYLWIVIGAAIGLAAALVVPGMQPGVGLGAGVAAGLAIGADRREGGGHCRLPWTTKDQRQPEDR